MKYITAFFVLLVAKLSAQSDLVFLNAIAQVESGNNDQAIGPCGERGRYQITPAVWFQHTRHPFTDAHKSTQATAVALKHLHWLRDEINLQLAHADRPRTSTYHDLAMAWHAGWNYRFQNRSAQKSLRLHDYARRVLNIYTDCQ